MIITALVIMKEFFILLDSNDLVFGLTCLVILVIFSTLILVLNWKQTKLRRRRRKNGRTF